MSVATVRFVDRPDLGDHGVRLIVDCRHGTTYVDRQVPHGGHIPSESMMVRLAIAKHEDEEHCGCARGLDTIVHHKAARA